MPRGNRRAMVEDRGDGVLQHRKRHGAEEQEPHDAHDTHHLALGEEASDLIGDGVGLAGNQEVQIRGHGFQQALFVDEMRERHQQHREEGHDGQQRVVGHRPREQQSLTPLEVGEHRVDKVTGEGKPRRHGHSLRLAAANGRRRQGWVPDARDPGQDPSPAVARCPTGRAGTGR